VAARASAFSFRGRADDLEAIAEKLNVGTVLEGSVRRAGDRVRITTQLSNATQGKVLWSERFDRELKDIFDVQEEIARAIVERLRVSLAPTGERLVQKRTTNIKAYELLLQGRVLLMKRGPAIVNALNIFEQAIALDPNLGDAHAGLGDTYRLMGIYGLMRPNEILPKARASLERALELDPNNVEALATLANIAMAFEWDFVRAHQYSERALALDPTHVRAITERAITTATSMVSPPPPHLRGFVLDQISRARSLDPLNPWVMAIESMTLMITGDLDAAFERATQAREIDGTNFTAHWSLVVALAAAERDEEARQAAEASFAVFKRHPAILAEMAAIESRQGNRAAADAIFSELQDRSKTTYIGEGVRAVVAASAGKFDEARQLLATATAERDAYIPFNKHPAWRPLRTDHGCMALLSEIAYVKNGMR
jgi:tetratricopeptide (TPR) repeat protein